MLFSDTKMPVHPDVLKADRAPKGLESTAPEHYRDALEMQRDERGMLVISLTEAVKSALWPRPEKKREVWIGLGRKEWRKQRFVYGNEQQS